MKLCIFPRTVYKHVVHVVQVVQTDLRGLRVEPAMTRHFLGIAGQARNDAAPFLLEEGSRSTPHDKPTNVGGTGGTKLQKIHLLSTTFI